MKLYLVNYATPGDCIESDDPRAIYEEAEPAGFVTTNLDAARKRVVEELEERWDAAEQVREMGFLVRDCTWTENNELVHHGKLVAVLSYREEEV